MKPRPYQAKCLGAVREDYEHGIEKLLAVLATALGKTVIFSHIPAWFPDKRTIVLVHTEELAEQAAAKLRLCNPERSVGIEMGSRRADGNDHIVVASVQTLGREGSARIGAFRPDKVGAVIIDEAHHATATGYERVLRYFGMFGNEAPCGKLLLGVTATPGRTDGIGLARVFDRISYSYGLIDGVRDGYLCRPVGIKVRTSVNLDGLHTSQGDFIPSELSLAINTPARNKLVVEEWLKHGERRKSLGFTVDIKHAVALAEAFRARDVRAEAVWGEDPRRELKIGEHKRHNLDVLLNASVLTEGYDDPGIMCILNVAPTKSQLRYIQRIGRGGRLPEGIDNLNEARAAGMHLPKEDFLVIDMTDATTRHSLATLPSVFGLPPKLDLRGGDVVAAIAALDEAKRIAPEVDFSDLEDLQNVQSYVERVDLFNVKYRPEVEQNSRMQWHKTANGDYLLMLPKNESIRIEQDLLGQWKIRGKVQGNEFEDGERDLPSAFGRADDMLRYFGRSLMKLVRRDVAGKEAKEPMTVKQENAIRFRLRMAGKEVPDLRGMTKHAANKVLTKLRAA